MTGTRHVNKPQFDGVTYEPRHDYARLKSQLDRVKMLMSDGEWRTLHEIAQITGGTTQSVSARLRDLRKVKFGGYLVERKRVGESEEGLHAYCLRLDQPSDAIPVEEMSRKELLAENKRLRTRVEKLKTRLSLVLSKKGGLKR